MMPPVELLSAMLAGLGLGAASAPHCALMCGPLAAACGVSTHAPRRLGLYQTSRTIAYCALGGALGTAGASAGSAWATPWGHRAMAWALAGALAWMAYRLWRGARAPVVSAASPGLKKKLPVLSPVAIGVASAFLPCGALLAALLAAAATESALGGSLLMLGFASTTALGVLGIGLLSRLLFHVRRPIAARLLSATLAFGAVVTMARSWSDTKTCCHSRHAD